MSQSSLAEQLKEAGIPVKRGVKVATQGGQGMTVAGSNLWLYRWAANSYKNYPIVSRAKGVRLLADSAVGMPSILVGVGPSLDETIESVKRAEGRAILISSDAALRALLAHDITPDIVLSYDCKPEQSLLWQDIPGHQITALFDSCAHPDAIASWKGPILFYNHYHQADELSRMILPHVYPTIGQIPSGGTVGNSMLFLSKILGCEPAITVGMDFCYARKGNFQGRRTWRYRAKDYRYEDGKWFEAEIKSLYDNEERAKRAFLRTFDGSEYQTDPELEFYRENFLAFVKHFKINAVNTALQGSLKDAIPTMRVDAAVEKYCPASRLATSLDQILKDGWPDPRVNP